MPRTRTEYLESLVDSYLNVLTRNKQSKKGTTDEYRRLLVLALDALQVAGLRSTPTKIGEDEIYFLRDEYYASLDPTTNRRQIGILGTFLKHYNNNVVERMHLAWPQGRRASVKWLPPESCVRLIDAAEGMEKPLVHMELLLLMRRVEVLRLRIQDIKWNAVDVLGKGRGEGKWRTVPWARETLAVLQHYQRMREDMIEKALAKDAQAAIPEQFMIYCQYGWKLGAYRESAVDKMLKTAAARASLAPEDVSNHVLRRSGARMMIYAGANIVDVSTMLGHADTRTTMLYLGLTLDDLSKVQEKRDDYLDLVRMKMRAEPLGQAVARPVLIAR